MDNIRKITVTGALGHIGSSLVRRLPDLFPGCRIQMIDNLLTQRYCSLFGLPDTGKYAFSEKDIATADITDEVAGADVIIHLAAITDAAGSFEKRALVEQNNFESTKMLAAAAIRHRCALIHLSSTSVYGTQNDVVDESCSMAELQPQSPYAETKLKEEALLKELGSRQGLRFTTLRFGTICGKSPGMRFHTAVNKFCYQAVMARPLTVWKTAYHQKRPYLSLDDGIQAIAHVIRSDLFSGEIYNVLTDNLSVKAIIDMISTRIPQIAIDYVDSRIMNQLSYEVLCEKFKRTGFSITGSIQQAISETIDILRISGLHNSNE